ncbi:MAG: quinolinate synthase NadA [Cellulosilyticum sp.]|nr:quinolinate synthase NadA [Cellulosilyticum sp.]
MDTQTLIHRIKKLKKEKNALIVAHYYVKEEIQELADYVGDSYYLSKICKEREEKHIIFCGVKFMGESAKILNPEKQIMMASCKSDCPMAHMITVNQIETVKRQYKDLAVVCYINSTAEIKACADIVVTSSNAYRIISQLKEKNIFFVPDAQLGQYLMKQFPDKHFILDSGYCYVHTSITREEVEKLKVAYPKAKVLVHPECLLEVVDMADYVGSTAGMIQYATKSKEKEFIICSETGILYELKKKNPHKVFYTVGTACTCTDMKQITLQDVYDALTLYSSVDIQLDERIAKKARHALVRMHELGG